MAPWTHLLFNALSLIHSWQNLFCAYSFFQHLFIIWLHEPDTTLRAKTYECLRTSPYLPYAAKEIKTGPPTVPCKNLGALSQTSKALHHLPFHVPNTTFPLPPPLLFLYTWAQHCHHTLTQLSTWRKYLCSLLKDGCSEGSGEGQARRKWLPTADTDMSGCKQAAAPGVPAENKGSSPRDREGRGCLTD